MTEESEESADLKQKSKKYKTASYLNAMNENEKLLNHKIIRNMNKRINFLKNPRFVAENPTITIRSLIEKPVLLFLSITNFLRKEHSSTRESQRESF